MALQCRVVQRITVQTEKLYDESHKMIGIREFAAEKCRLCRKDILVKDDTFLFDDEDAKNREYLARKGYNLAKYVHDTAANVRRTVAELGYGRDVLVYDEHPMVLRTIVQLCEGIIGGWKTAKNVDVDFCLNILKDSKHNRIRNKARRLIEMQKK